MPPKGKSKAKKKQYKKRAPKLVSMGAPSGMPAARRANLRYVESFVHTSTAGSLANANYSANGLFDPTLAVGGHQPFGFNQWETLFNHYVVVGSKITVNWYTGSLTEPVAIGVYLSDDNSIPYTITDYIKEARKGTQKVLAPSNQRTIMTSAKYSCRKFFNITDVKDNLNRLGSNVAANPNDQAIYHVYMQARNAGTETVNYTVQIDYIVEFSEPKDIPYST